MTLNFSYDVKIYVLCFAFMATLTIAQMSLAVFRNTFPIEKWMVGRGLLL